MFLYQGWYLHKEKETSFLTCMAHFGLRVTSLLKSRHQHEASLVQVVFTKEFFIYLTEWYPLVYDLSDHLPNFLIFNKFSSLPSNVKIFKRDYSKFDQQAFISEIQLIDWKLFLHPMIVHAICLNLFILKYLV